MAEILDLDDMQGIITRGYADLRAAAYMMLEIGDPGAARAWLSRLAGMVTAAPARPRATALNVAFTASGVRALGLAPETLALFSTEFVEGMTTMHRQRALGDTEGSAPEHWNWGGPATPRVDVVLMLFATDAAALAALSSTRSAEIAATRGLRVVTSLDTVDLGDIEHFGFHDGISQPAIAGLHRRDIAANTIRAGEFILGYRNEYGRLTPRPIVAMSADSQSLLPRDPGGSGGGDLGRNGSYLVFRQLRQDVRSFWRFLDAAAADPDGTSNPEARTALAARMVGRWPSGAPLTRAPARDDPALADTNNFGYARHDAAGLMCPIGAHVRRANPRDALDPRPGTASSVAVGKRHRILRRGREYGPPLSPADAAGTTPADVPVGEERGLHFICLNANIGRQFEFIQHTWVNNPKFAGLYDDQDALLGAHFGSGRTFTIQGRPLRRRVTGLPRFVTVRGGAYFFLPGIRALHYLAALGV
ncbi:MAG: peroxidase [Chloroflexota bacterium]